MTFRIGSYFTRALVLAASLGPAWSCSSRAADPPAGAAPEAAPSPSDAATTASESASTPAPDSAAKSAPADAAPAAAADSQYLKYDPATKTVTFELVAGPFDFDGFTAGAGTLTVPPGTTNVWNFLQNDGTPHSAEVGAGTGPIPNSGGNPAIPRAYTNKVVEGLVQGATDVIRFTAPDSGTYRIICGVPGHALGGMWIWFKVDPAAKAPSFGATPK